MLRFALVVVVVMLGTAALARHGDALDPRAGRSDAADCRHAKRVVVVRVSRRPWPHVAAHVEAIRGRYPRVWHLDRRHADEHREASLWGVRTRAGFDRDEQPPAFSREGGRGADVRLVPSSEPLAGRGDGGTVAAVL
jgi:hypothetical protein